MPLAPDVGAVHVTPPSVDRRINTVPPSVLLPIRCSAPPLSNSVPPYRGATSLICAQVPPWSVERKILACGPSGELSTVAETRYEPSPHTISEGRLKSLSPEIAGKCPTTVPPVAASIAEWSVSGANGVPVGSGVKALYRFATAVASSP